METIQIFVCVCASCECRPFGISFWRINGWSSKTESSIRTFQSTHLKCPINESDLCSQTYTVSKQGGPYLGYSEYFPVERICVYCALYSIQGCTDIQCSGCPSLKLLTYFNCSHISFKKTQVFYPKCENEDHLCWISKDRDKIHGFSFAATWLQCQRLPWTPSRRWAFCLE